MYRIGAWHASAGRNDGLDHRVTYYSLYASEQCEDDIRGVIEQQQTMDLM